MSHGVPDIACPVGGVPEVVEDGKTGGIVPPKDVAALTSAILKLVTNTELRESMATRSLERVRAHFLLSGTIGDIASGVTHGLRTNGGDVRP
jgi:glycosyltransferase involved in cell wall biosynthesis